MRGSKSLEMVGSMSFKKIERSYYSTPNGLRLATFKEVTDGLNMIKEKQILGKWDRVRLLDGWITGEGYNFEMGNDFKGCLGYMLLIETHASGFAYADVELSDSGKEVALFLCVDDWNFEVVYCLLNSWSKSETMNLADVRGGNIPLINAAKFKDMNDSIGHVARRVGNEAGAVREKAVKIKYSGVNSVEDVLSGMLKCVTEEEEIVQCIGQRIWHFSYYEAEEYYLPESVKPEEVAEAFWSFVCDSFAGYVVEVCALESLLHICNMKKKSTSGNNFMVATRILLYLSDFRTNVIHEPMAHDCTGSCAAKILSYAAKDGDPNVFNEMVKKNGMWRCYDENGNYSVLHKLLTVVVKAKYNYIDEREKVVSDVVKMLLGCGAQPERRNAIGKSKRKTNLHIVAKFRDEDVGTEVAEALLRRCDEQSIGDFVNAADDRGRTALHRASEKGNARICKVLLDWGASLTAQDENKMTPLHYALEVENDIVTSVLLESPLVTESLDLKDDRNRRALDIAVTNKDHVSTAKLLSKTEEPEAYFNKVDKEQLLRYSILVGSVNIVYFLFGKGTRLPGGDCDDDGRTVLHLAAMCDDEHSANGMTEFIIEATEENVEKMVVIQDRRGRTALHEAALKGHVTLCLFLLELNSELIYVKDRNGQNPLFDAVRGKSNGTVLFKQLQVAYLKKDRPEDDLVDRSGLTPLHVAASEGNARASHVKELLSSDKIKIKYLSRGDMVGQTALHKAAKRGDIETVEILLKNGAHPLRERDCDGGTGLHYAVQAVNGDKIKLAETLLKRCREEEKSLLLWASSAGFGTADQNLRNDDHLQKFLVNKKEKYKCNLLRTAASIGDIHMMKELLSRGYQMGDIHDTKWKETLTKANQKNVERVSKQIEEIKEQANDKPAISDSLGRLDYAHGLAALFLNPYIKPPIAVGITGSWGMGKSSLMMQTQRILLTTAADMALLQSSKSSSSASKLPEIGTCQLSKRGKRKSEHICRQIDQGKQVHGNILKILWNNLKSKPKIPSVIEVQQKLEDFLKCNDLKHLKILKAVAAMDSSDMLEKNVSTSEAEEETVPAVLTVQYNAWKYKNDTEALAGLAVEITSQLEEIMTPAQWLNTCWRYNWEKKKFTILFEIFIPCFLAMVLASSIAWIAWIVLGSEKFKKWGEAKYAWPPAAAVTILWTLTRKVMGVLKPISSQLMQYVSAPDHSDKLGYQERVISDIKFLKAEIGEKPHWVFIVFAWICSTFSVLLRHRSVGKAMEALKISPASGSHLRIIVFVDDLDRCDESVILKVLSAVNLVLAVCDISVVLGMDKRLIESAILKKHGDQNTGISLIDSQKLAEMYLQKIIQLPLDLPDPSDEETKKFLRAQLGVLQENEDKESMKDEGEGEAVQQNTPAEVEINVLAPDLETTGTERRKRTEIGKEIGSQTDGNASAQQNSRPSVVENPFILRREILFVSYSKGEEKAFLYFQSLATECRKLPREWKRLLNYHRLVWYIFSVSKEANILTGWQVQFITWIFVCWEWQENMDFVIKKWREIDLKPSESNGLSLLTIVEHLMEEHQREMKATSNAEVDYKRTLKTNDQGGGIVAETNNDEETESSSTEEEELNEKKKATSKKLVKKKNATSMKLDALVNSLARLEEEMKELKELVSNEMEKKIKELQKKVSGEMKKDINELKRHMVKQQNGENEENMEPEKLKFKNWKNWERMKSALEKYDVPMDAIHAFQRFRFYCIAGYLPLHS